MVALIAAYSKNRVIGKDGKIPWDLPGEQTRFRELTMGQVVVMGRKTFEEIGHPLPGRETIVVSTTKRWEENNCHTVKSLEQALAFAHTQWGNHRDLFISGGAGLYGQALELVEKMFITEIDAQIEGDTYFPVFEESLFYKKVERRIQIRGQIPYTYLTYTRK